VCGPGGADIGDRSIDMDFGNGHFGTYLRVREDFGRKSKRCRCKNKPVRKESF
jgi:hypothetical protein